ncbi:DNA repair protein complementing XP-A cells homolog [Harmonia axyridis]|uniref:DNA repair protein complementing XP-A cells homolog n=1 Tax=Harmonia axyridis TaxID=115357 RepID=UPI001E276EA1|nr:DNA repair protein complementing XP-A cells homolog [Harmonia axyridis]
MSEHEKEELTESAKARIERNRQRAIILRNSKLVAHPYAKGETISVDTATIKIGATKYIDTGGGFLLEEVEGQEPIQTKPVEDEPPIHEEDRPFCIKCDRPFAVSWLFDKFGYKCCDECKDPEEHALITKTDAVNTFLLKAVDLEKREPPLKFITKKNPHNVRWGDMKLYLRSQVEERALQVWGSHDEIEKEKINREEKKVMSKSKKYNKELKALRMNMRSSLYDRTSAASHTHNFGPETYNEEDDTYTHKCLTCPYVETFEKM